MEKVVVVGDTFAGQIQIGDKIYSISGTWTETKQGLVTANGKGVIVEGDIGEYICPVDGVQEQVIAKATSRLDGVNEIRLHRIGDLVDVVSHTNISVVSTSGQDNVISD